MDPLHIPEGVKAGLIAAGGCTHEPRPWVTCDVCSRPIPYWALSAQNMILAPDWQGRTVDNVAIEKRDVLSMDNVPRDKLASLNVMTTSPRAPVIRAVVDPRKDERLFMFTRHFLKMGMEAGVDGKPKKVPSRMSCVMLEVRQENARPVYLIVHPQALILSTEDLYF